MTSESIGVLVAFSDEMAQASRELKRFLFANLYRHPEVTATTGRAREVIAGLFAAYRTQGIEGAIAMAPDLSPERAIADYIAGMTDRFATREFERLAGMRAFP